MRMLSSHLRFDGKRVFRVGEPARPVYLISGDKVVDAKRPAKLCFKIRGDKVVQSPATIVYKIRMNRWVDCTSGEVAFQMK